MPLPLSDLFIDLTWVTAIQVILLGFIGGVLSGFIGSGGAFFMTPGMMNLGAPGVVAVASNITHKFGKAMMGAKKHGELGNVDKKLGAILIVTSFIGIRLAVWINTRLFKGAGDGHGAGGSAAADLYISAIFMIVLSMVAVSMLNDVVKGGSQAGPSKRIAEFFSRMKLFPLIHFPLADVKVSIWLLLIVGLVTGYLAGTIGVGGFIGVPAMIYIFGVPTAVATGTELFLAMFMGAFGALNYAYQGLVDIRLTLLLYMGSLFGIYIGAYGSKMVKEVMIRLVTSIIILLCVVSRVVAIPVYMRELSWITFNPAWDAYFEIASKVILFIAGTTGVAIILYNVLRAYVRARRLAAKLGRLAKGDQGAVEAEPAGSEAS
jgi:uncharacterized membrane protein YfcA